MSEEKSRELLPGLLGSEGGSDRTDSDGPFVYLTSAQVAAVEGVLGKRIPVGWGVVELLLVEHDQEASRG
jgi:hypothetical protein